MIGCKNRNAYDQIIARTVFHMDRTKDYMPEFKQLDPIFASFCAIGELKSCVYYRKRWFTKPTSPGDISLRDVKDDFRIGYVSPAAKV